jgi:hypothetical protein
MAPRSGGDNNNQQDYDQPLFVVRVACIPLASNAVFAL